MGSVTHESVSDLEADHAHQQEGREEGVEENKVQCVSGQSARIAVLNYLIALSDQTGSWERAGDICKHRKGMTNVTASRFRGGPEL